PRSGNGWSRVSSVPPVGGPRQRPRHGAGEPAVARAAGIEWGADDTRLRVSADISTAGAIAASPPFRTGFQDLMNVQLSPPSSLPAAPSVTDDALVRSGENVFAIEARALETLRPRLDGAFAQACRTMLGCRGRVVAIGMGKS